MKPTAKLRYLHETTRARSMESAFQASRRLQQWWAVEREGQETPEGEWRDIPTEHVETVV